MTTRLLTLLTFSAATAMLGCAKANDDAGGDKAASPPATTGRRAAATGPVEPPSTQPVTLTGTLRGGLMAIGGETTGWTLVGDAQTGGTELDVSAVRAEAERLDGKRVTVTGTLTDRKYVERGTVRVLKVDRITPAQ